MSSPSNDSLFLTTNRADAKVQGGSEEERLGAPHPRTFFLSTAVMGMAANARDRARSHTPRSLLRHARFALVWWVPMVA